MRRLYPEPAGPVSLAEAYRDPPRSPVGGRPWVGLCMVASLDGSTVVDGTSGALSNPDDAAVFATLRSAADAIIVGATTASRESYGVPKKPGQRVGVVTATAAIDPASELFRSGAGFLILPEDGPDAPVGPGGPIDTVRAGSGLVDLAAALARLGELIPEPRFVQAEGGSRLNGALLAADCVDELDLTISPVLVGGDGARLTSGAPPVSAGFDLAHVLVDERSFLYTRWLRARS